jgi:hypothetical protein
LTAAKLFLQLALSGTGGRCPRVINVDGQPAYARAIAELKQSGDLSRRCRPSPYLNNIIEQDHRFIKKRVAASLGFRSAERARRTLKVAKQMYLIRKGQIRWSPKGDVVRQRQFIDTLFGSAYDPFICPSSRRSSRRIPVCNTSQLGTCPVNGFSVAFM